MDPPRSPTRLLFGNSPGVIAAVALLFGTGSLYGLLLGELGLAHLLLLALMLLSARAVSELRLRGLGGLLLGVLLTLALTAAVGALVRAVRGDAGRNSADTGVR